MGDRLPLESRDMNVISGSDSDSSDADSPPKIRKTRSTRSVRSTLAANPTAVPVPFPKKQVSVYSTRVTKCLEDLKSGRIQLCIDKDEEEIVDPLQPDVKANNRVPIVTLDESKDDLECSHVTTPESSFVRSRSPTPPPTPDSTVTQKPTRTRRMNRNMKKALQTLEGMKDTIRVHSSSEDEDLVIISHLSSPAPETTSMTAKIRYKSKIYKYSMRKADTFQSIKTRLAGDIDVEEDHLFFMLADRNILPTETPHQHRPAHRRYHRLPLVQPWSVGHVGGRHSDQGRHLPLRPVQQQEEQDPHQDQQAPGIAQADEYLCIQSENRTVLFEVHV
ncbi:NFATC2-interacting protein-like isoform X2 [Haliotis rubra]|uniref:NFATC2-interacting protein-like isoform X2 n=1 Tax=Haliotis rubra TaxID=36100 RepID=UPI001EE58D90|nr:NFATC2-interacting protein-like isoform X2 [Haliotis rubra]